MVDFWEAPGEGMWFQDIEHLPGPCTRFFGDVFTDAATKGFERGFSRYALPLLMSFEIVNGRVYGSLRATPAETWDADAARIDDTRDLWRLDIRDWFDHRRDEIVRANVALQDEDVSAMSDAELADHVTRAAEAFREGTSLHMDLVCVWMPVGEFLVAGQEWGIEGAELLQLLKGASPSSTETMPFLERIDTALRASGVGPTSLDEIERASAEAAAALRDYVSEYGWRMVSAYDVDGRVLNELPATIVASIAAVGTGRDGASVDTDSVRSRVPEAERERFDALLSAARESVGSEDANVGVTVMWRAGLCRRALLEAGARLAARGAIEEATDIFEATADEAVALLSGSGGLSREELVARVAERARRSEQEAPPVLGEEMDLPLDAMPPELAARTIAILTLWEASGAAPADDLSGTGIGTEPYVGIARVASDPLDAIERLEAGDVLVVPYTTPAFSAVMVLAGALVVETGGPLIHAAVLAREFGIPAVVGARGAVATIKDGDEVEVDPRAGRVRVVARPRGL